MPPNKVVDLNPPMMVQYRYHTGKESPMINLIYIRAAIRERTGQELSLDQVIQALLQEGLISKAQSKDRDLIFRGYGEYFEFEDASTKVEDPNPFIDRELTHEDEES